jgi:hypothetical protein
LRPAAGCLAVVKVAPVTVSASASTGTKLILVVMCILFVLRDFTRGEAGQAGLYRRRPAIARPARELFDSCY